MNVRIPAAPAALKARDQAYERLQAAYEAQADADDEAFEAATQKVQEATAAYNRAVDRCHASRGF